MSQAAATIHTSTNSLALAFYGTAAIAYDRVGTNENKEIYEQIASEECAKMEAALRAIAIESEPNPAKINWNCQIYDFTYCEKVDYDVWGLLTKYLMFQGEPFLEEDYGVVIGRRGYIESVPIK